jgi:peptide/nickel transport system permease protein
VTLGLVLYASLIILAVGIGLGILAALRPGATDTSVIVATTISAALPAFVAAIILLLVFAVNLGWFPATGEGEGVLGRIEHLTLPAIALAMTSVALVGRVTRSAVRDELGREHVQTAVSRGIPFRLVLRRHVLRNAAIPITTIAGLTIASLIAVSAVVERAFALNGLGAYLVESAQSKDFAVVQGISLVLVAAFVITNMVVDILYALLDPRVTLGTKSQ